MEFILSLIGFSVGRSDSIWKCLWGTFVSSIRAGKCLEVSLHWWDLSIKKISCIRLTLFLAFKNGGGNEQGFALRCSAMLWWWIGAFIIPYFCVYFLIGTPLFFLEMSLGQFTSSCSAAAFKMSRMFKGESSFHTLLWLTSSVSLCWSGLGWATAINSFLVSIYYNVIIAWCLFYFFASFRRTFQWGECGHWWNTERCVNAGSLDPMIINESVMFARC